MLAKKSSSAKKIAAPTTDLLSAILSTKQNIQLSFHLKTAYLAVIHCMILLIQQLEKSLFLKTHLLVMSKQNKLLKLVLRKSKFVPYSVVKPKMASASIVMVATSLLAKSSKLAKLLALWLPNPSGNLVLN